MLTGFFSKLLEQSSSIREFLNEFGRELSIVSTSPNLSKEAKSKRLALQLHCLIGSESMGNHDSVMVDASSVG